MSKLPEATTQKRSVPLNERPIKINLSSKNKQGGAIDVIRCFFAFKRDVAMPYLVPNFKFDAKNEQKS